MGGSFCVCWVVGIVVNFCGGVVVVGVVGVFGLWSFFGLVWFLDLWVL